ncbi:MAG: ferredoxin reductase [Solirubrobacterales bacterium]|nr:ferredoxin reductase [Solirubrobacterales bacterium]
MAERGAAPKVSPARRRTLRAVRSLFTPLVPDDYLDLINPLWSTRELRGRIESIRREAADAVTVTIRPGQEWAGHEPGQYLRIGVIAGGVHHWRAYSITSDPGRPDGFISITPKLLDSGVVSRHLVRRARPGDIVRLGGVEGTFRLPEPLPARSLFISAGSGVTPIMAMLRSLERRDALGDTVHLHSARTERDVIFGEQLRLLAARQPGYALHVRRTGEQGRLTPALLGELCPDWHEREAFVCGPAAMLDAMSEQWHAAGDSDRLHMERFQPVIGAPGGASGEGGSVRFVRSAVQAASDGSQPILVAGEEAGARLPFGCRMGVCHTCIGRLCSGRVRDLRTGEVSGADGEMVRTCVNAPEGAVVIDL